MLRGPSRDASGDIVILAEVDIDARAEEIWPYLVDWEHLDRWMAEASDFRVVSPQREGIGVEAEATVAVGRITTRDRVRVTRWEPPSVLEIAHLGWVGGHGYLELSPLHPRGTNVFWRERLKPPMGVLGRIGMRLYRRRLEQQFADDLVILRTLVEEEIPPGP
ncbi:MAG TPA: SRPBCC family protein [Actinomycetota bacterium]|nr:SRPBCC family protein [Actinomycetota bacterium]